MNTDKDDDLKLADTGKKLLEISKMKVARPGYLLRLALMFIYDRDRMRKEQIELMQKSILGWLKKFDLDECLQQIIPEEHEAICKIAWLLREDEQGRLDHRKKLFKDHNIDYRKFYRLPEAYTAEGKYKAEQLYKKYAITNPEQEGLSDSKVDQLRKEVQT